MVETDEVHFSRGWRSVVETSECRSCGTAIVWAKSRNGKNMPVDAAPADGGNVELVGTLEGLEARVVSEGERAGRRLHVSHFVTCPNASMHRRRSS